MTTFITICISSCTTKSRLFLPNNTFMGAFKLFIVKITFRMVYQFVSFLLGERGITTAAILIDTIRNYTVVAAVLPFLPYLTFWPILFTKSGGVSKINGFG